MYFMTWTCDMSIFGWLKPESRFHKVDALQHHRCGISFRPDFAMQPFVTCQNLVRRLTRRDRLYIQRKHPLDSKSVPSNEL
jgi:hypothetical protein